MLEKRLEFLFYVFAFTMQCPQLIRIVEEARNISIHSFYYSQKIVIIIGHKILHSRPKIRAVMLMLKNLCYIWLLNNCWVSVRTRMKLFFRDRQFNCFSIIYIRIEIQNDCLLMTYNLKSFLLYMKVEEYYLNQKSLNGNIELSGIR